MKRNSAPALTREQIKERVIGVSLGLFHQLGVKSVTMDDIAHALQMSKRTLYQLFTDKEELLLACVRFRDAEDRRRLADVVQRSDSVLDVLLNEFDARLRSVENLQPAFVADIMKFPRVQEFVKARRAADRANAVAFFERGVEQGYFRGEVDYDVVYDLLGNQLENIFSGRTHGKYTFVQLFVNTALVIVRGCATVKGIALIDDFLERYKRDAGTAAAGRDSSRVQAL